MNDAGLTFCGSSSETPQSARVWMRSSLVRIGLFVSFPLGCSGAPDVVMLFGAVVAGPMLRWLWSLLCAFGLFFYDLPLPELSDPGPA